MNLVFIEKNRPVTDSLKIAEVFGKSHDNVMRDIRIQIQKLIEAGEHGFSLLNFEESEYTNERGRTYQKFILTENAFAMITMSYVTVEAMRFKVNFISEFNNMKIELINSRFKLPQTYSEALRALATSEEEKAIIVAENEKLSLETTHQKRTIQEQEPKVAMYQLTLAADNTQPVGTVARVVGMGRNTLFKFLREKKILMPHSTLPYQKYIDAGYFIVKEVPTPRGDRVENVATTRVTAKGLDYIAKMIPNKGA